MNVLVLKLNNFVKKKMSSPSTKQQIINLKSKHTRASNKLQYQSLEQKMDLLREYLFNHVTATNSSLCCQQKLFENISDRLTKMEINSNNSVEKTLLPMHSELLENF